MTTKPTENLLKNYTSTFILLGAIIIGAIIGAFAPDFALKLKPLGDIFLNLIFTSVVPLIFFAVASSVLQMHTGEKTGRILLLTGVVFVVTALLAALFSIIVLYFFPLSPIAQEFTEPAEHIFSTDIVSQVVSAFTVNDFSLLLSKSSMLALIVFSLLIGFAVRMVNEQGEAFKSFIISGNEVMKKLLYLIMKLAPIGLGAYFAYLVASMGTELLKTYAESTLIYYVAALIYYLSANSLYAFVAKGFMGIKNYWKNNITPSLTALGTCSSIATIPANLIAGEKMNISPSVNRLSIPLGGALHKEGSALGAIIKIAVLFAILNKPFFDFDTLMLALFIALLTSIVEGGIPNGGYIGEIFIVTAYGFPPEFLPVVTVVATLIDPMATLLNATGDTSSAMLIDKLHKSEGV